MKSLNIKKYSGAVFSLALLIAVIAVYVFALAQVNEYVLRMSRALSDTETLSARDAQVRSVENLSKETVEQREALQSVVITDTDVVSVIKILENTAKDEQVDLSISSVSVTQPDGWLYHERVDVVFSTQGRFVRVLAFTHAIESLPFAARLESGRVQLSSGSNWFGSHTVTFIKQKI